MTLPDIHDIPLAAIEIGKDRTRDLEPAWATALAALIGRQGLMQPIIVRPIEGAFRKYLLVAGLHRFEAVRLLGRDSIPAFLSSAASDDEARLEEVMENLGRYELIALDRCKHLYELKRIYDAKYPDAGRGGRPRKGGKTFPTFEENSLPIPDSAPEVFGFSASVADQVGLSKRAINAAVKIWIGLAPQTRARLIGSDLARKQTELKALSELATPRQQMRILDLILGEDHPDIQNVAAALAFLESGITPTPLEKKFRSLCDGVKALPDAALDLLLIENEARVLEALKRLGRI